MKLKGFAYARKYKTPKFGYVSKANRVEEERKARIKRAKTLTTQESIAYETIREFGIAQMEAIGKGTTVDEAEYAKLLIERLNV